MICIYELQYGLGLGFIQYFQISQWVSVSHRMIQFVWDESIHLIG
jgi:hypothetical protein